MGLTKTKKRIRDERKKLNPDNKCLKCGEPLKNSIHHYFCNDCYVPGIQCLPEYKWRIQRMKQRYEKYNRLKMKNKKTKKRNSVIDSLRKTKDTLIV